MGWENQSAMLQQQSKIISLIEVKVTVKWNWNQYEIESKEAEFKVK